MRKSPWAVMYDRDVSHRERNGMCCEGGASSAKRERGKYTGKSEIEGERKKTQVDGAWMVTCVQGFARPHIYAFQI